MAGAWLKKTLIIKRGAFLLVAAGFLPNANLRAEEPCAVLLKYGGQVQLLDASRTRLIHTAPQAAIACGSWISIDMGWALIRHREGHYLNLGVDSFAQFKSTSKSENDHVVLYKGQLHADVDGERGELRVLTANSRSFHGRGRSLLVYSEYDEETQLISIEGSSRLENRFQARKPVAVRAGEATSLNSKALRVVPSAPRAVAVSALKQRLGTMHVSEREIAIAADAARKRTDRKIASELKAPATQPKSADPYTYERHAPAKRSRSGMSDEQLKRHMLNRAVSGVAGGEKIAHPRTSEKPVKGKVLLHHDRSPKEEAERRKLIEELSRINGG